MIAIMSRRAICNASRCLMKPTRPSPFPRPSRRREKLEALAAEIAERAPEMKPTEDRVGRISDFTWDIGEYESVPSERVDFVASIIAAHGARSSRSSVHLHATFDADDKASGTVRLLASRFGVDAGAARFRWAFAGDSGNDRACFAAMAASRRRS